MLTKNFLKSLSSLEISVLMSIFGSEFIIKPDDLVFLKKRFFVLTLQREYDKLPKEGYNRWRIVIESILKKLL